MAIQSSASFSSTLDVYAFGVAQDLSSPLAEFFAPTVTVPSSVGKFKKFDSQNAFQTVDTTRAIGGGARRLEFLATDADYNCKPQALEIAIDDAEMKAAGDSFALKKAKMDTLVASAVASHESKVFKLIEANVSAVADAGVWSDPDVDPIREIDQQIKAITIATGIMPNRIGLGVAAWEALRNHARVVARQPGAQVIGLTPEQFAAMTLNPTIQVRVGVLSRDLAKFGATTNPQNILGSEAYIFLGSDHPTVYDPSFAKTFRTGMNGVQGVQEYRCDNNRSQILCLDWSEDVQVVSTSSVRRITIS